MTMSQWFDKGRRMFDLETSVKLDEPGGGPAAVSRVASKTITEDTANDRVEYERTERDRP